MPERLRLLELFGGIGACSRALGRLGINYEVADYVEVDRFAAASYNAIHGTDFPTQDIREWDRDIRADLVMHGSPCQDFSVAGRNAGGDLGSGTRSSLLWESVRIIGKLRPKYVVWENVKNVLSKKHRHNFDGYLRRMEEMGYRNFYKVLNSRDYGIPQNRERVFSVSVRGDLPQAENFTFPKTRKPTITLKDLLEKDVEEKYYLSEKQAGNLLARRFSASNFTYSLQRGMVARTLLARDYKDPKLVAVPEIIDDTYGCRPPRGYTENAPTIRAGHGWFKVIAPDSAGACIPVKCANSRGYDLAGDGDAVNLAYPTTNQMRGRVGHGVSNTLTSSGTMGVLDGMRIRRLTPREYWRLMGFDDSDYEKAAAVNSMTQLYKQAGNSIVVDVLEAVLGSLLRP